MATSDMYGCEERVQSSVAYPRRPVCEDERPESLQNEKVKWGAGCLRAPW